MSRNECKFCFSAVCQCKTSVHIYFVSCISNRGENCTKIALKSQLVYTRDFEVATSARQKLHCIAQQKSPVYTGLYRPRNVLRWLMNDTRADHCSAHYSHCFARVFVTIVLEVLFKLPQHYFSSSFALTSGKTMFYIVVFNKLSFVLTASSL